MDTVLPASASATPLENASVPMVGIVNASAWLSPGCEWKFFGLESLRGAACAPGWGTARRSREGGGPSSAEHPVADRLWGTRRARSHW